MTSWLGDTRRAAATAGALLRDVPLLGGSLVLCGTVAGALALGVLLALADLATAPGLRTGFVLALLILGEVIAHTLCGLLAAVAGRRLTGALRRTVMAAAMLRMDGPGQAALAAARDVGIGRQPKPGAALPGITAWWITVVRRAGALALLATAGWWVPVAVAFAWLAAPVRRGPVITLPVLALVCHQIAGSAVAMGWRLVLLQAVLAAAADPGTTLARIRELMRSGVGLISAARQLPACAGTATAGRPAPDGQVALVPAQPLRLPATLADNVYLDAPHDGPPAMWTVTGLDELVRRLPAGEHTVLSADLRAGVDLGPDDWHRVALARALVRVNRGARLLVLAEVGPDALRAAEYARGIAPGLTAVFGEPDP